MRELDKRLNEHIELLIKRYPMLDIIKGIL